MGVAQELSATLVAGPARKSAWVEKLRTAVFGVLAAATAALCIPFLLRPEIDWTAMNPWLLALVATSTTAVVLHAGQTLTVRYTVLFAALALAMSMAAEFSGMWWRLPFGYTYAYHPALRPRIAGDLPLCVPPLWMVLAYTPVVFLRGLQVRAGGRLHPGRLAAKVVLCSLYLMAMDLFIDPLCVSVGTWTWPDGGAYLGVPILNFTGWFQVGLTIFLPYFILAREAPPAARPAALDVGFAAASISLTALCLAACVWRLGTWLPAVLTLGVLVPVWAYWFLRFLRPGLARAPRRG